MNPHGSAAGTLNTNSPKQTGADFLHHVYSQANDSCSSDNRSQLWHETKGANTTLT